jgi:DUF4097 and DUF4098 domain-containing protein YvlB
MRGKTNHRVGTLAWLLVLGLPVSAGAFEKNIPAAALTDVAVNSLSGSVEAIGWDKPDVLLEWTDDDPRPGEQVEIQAGRLRIGNDPEVGSGLTTDVKIYLPKRLKLVVRTISGDLKVQAMQAGCRLVAISGEVDARALAGGVEIKTVSGDVELNGIAGDVAVKTVSGQVQARALEGGLVEIKTVSGDVELRGALSKVRLVSHSGDLELRGSLQPDGSIQAKSFSGELNLYLPAKAGFDLDASTRSGSVSVQHALAGADVRPNKASGRANGGGGELQASSFSGDVSIRILE